MFVTMKPTRGNNSPLCHSALATTRRARSQLPARYQNSSYRITERSGGLPTGDHPPVCRAHHCSAHPLSVHSAQPFHVAVLGKHLGLEPAHGVGADGRSFRTTSPSNDHPPRRIVGQPFSVVGILVARQTTVHRLPEKAHQSVLHVATDPTFPQTVIRRLRQSQCIVQLAAGQQPTVRGDGSAAKLQPYTAVETELGAGGGAFTHWAPPGWLRFQDLHSSLPTSLPLMLTMVLCYPATLGVAATVYDTLRG